MSELKICKHRVRPSASAIPLIIVLSVCAVTQRATCRSSNPATTEMDRSYTTQFPLTENPISEGGNWINGQTTGLDWANVRTIRGLAFGTETDTVKYNDSTALLTGAWGPNQAAQATVHTVDQNDKIYEEVELRLRSALSAHQATGYEILFRCSKSSKAYAQIVRWNGAMGNFTYLNRANGSKYGVANGDVVKASIIGDVITAYINGVQVLQATDSTYASGSPGMGFYIERTTGVNEDFGFTKFTASDGKKLQNPTTAGAASVVRPRPGPD